MKYKCSCGAHTSNLHVFEQHLSKCLIFKALPHSITIDEEPVYNLPTLTVKPSHHVTTSDIFVPMLACVLTAVTADRGEQQ